MNCIVRTDATVLALKLILTNKIYEDCEKIRISYNEQLLDDDDAVIGEIGIPNKAELNLIVGDPQMVGGAGQKVIKSIINSKTTDKISTSDGPLFEQTFKNSVVLNTMTKINMKAELSFLSLETLKELEPYILHYNTTNDEQMMGLSHVYQSTKILECDSARSTPPLTWQR
ncbi:MAG: hypothetical protein ACKPKO_25905, partial [Candidatus Fonsibacter sp.]